MPEYVLLDRLDQMLAPPREVTTDLAELLRVVYDRRYTGPITLHFCAGIPRKAEFLAPQVKLNGG